ncbi:hypothetical protein [Yoonia litorea]|uniref:Uncharacterized protein n=1 Tax=Yoonia litorea TaxID=1123755 RepID=A0A1I6MXE7_9RHOB|nr:hypothetical protein [Yoonia litorea]SFS20370.1 hypothetical protein SAMN05444714_2607 [Yoonia litorea]
MKTTIALATATIFSMSSAAFAGGHFDAVVVNGGGKVVWGLNLDEEGMVTGGANNGGNGKTDKAAGGLADAPGLSIAIVEDDE